MDVRTAPIPRTRNLQTAVSSIHLGPPVLHPLDLLHPAADGCAFNGTLVKVGETGQDMEWWYTCTKSRWLISGCVNNGLRYKENDSFQLITRQGVFWGKCEKLDRYHYMRQPYGCVDAYGRNVDAGKIFQLNQLFWAKCLLNRTNTSVPEIGQVAVNVSGSGVNTPCHMCTSNLHFRRSNGKSKGAAMVQKRS